MRAAWIGGALGVAAAAAGVVWLMRRPSGGGPVASDAPVTATAQVLPGSYPAPLATAGVPISTPRLDPQPTPKPATPGKPIKPTGGTVKLMPGIQDERRLVVELK